jgi:hypothetical protein
MIIEAVNITYIYTYIHVYICRLLLNNVRPRKEL